MKSESLDDFLKRLNRKNESLYDKMAKMVPLQSPFVTAFATLTDPEDMRCFIRDYKQHIIDSERGDETYFVFGGDRDNSGVITRPIRKSTNRDILWMIRSELNRYAPRNYNDWHSILWSEIYGVDF